MFWEESCFAKICPGFIEVVVFDSSKECIDLVCVVRALQAIEEGNTFVVVAEGGLV